MRQWVLVEALQERWIRVIAKCNYILASAVTLAATISRWVNISNTSEVWYLQKKWWHDECMLRCILPFYIFLCCAVLYQVCCVYLCEWMLLYVCVVAVCWWHTYDVCVWILLNMCVYMCVYVCCGSVLCWCIVAVCLWQPSKGEKRPLLGVKPNKCAASQSNLTLLTLININSPWSKGSKQIQKSKNFQLLAFCSSFSSWAHHFKLSFVCWKSTITYKSTLVQCLNFGFSNISI